MAKEDVKETKGVSEEEALVALEREEAVKKLAALRAEMLKLEAEVGAIPLAPEDKVWVTIDIAPYANHLQINQQQYMHGSIYEVDQGTAAMLHEMMRRSWTHEQAIHGQENPLRRQINSTLRGH